MNVNITINGDIIIHCDCCEDCGICDDNFEKSMETPEAADEGIELSPEEAEAVVKAVAELIFPFLREEADD